ncbi:MAG: DMT family transporter [Candidatus Limnocylindrales bacterium]
MTPRTAAALRPWLLFGLLSLVWGSSYFWIKVGVTEGLLPFTLVTVRLSIAALGLALLMALTHGRLPHDRATLAKLAFLGLINVALPFGLITWAEQYVGSALASILSSLVPLFAIVFAALALSDEPATLNRLGGLAIGFVGAILLLGRNLAPAPGTAGDMQLPGDLALVLAAASYAASGVFIRRYLSGRKLIDDPLTGPRTLRPVEIALPQNVAALVVVAVLALLRERVPGGGLLLPPSTLAWVAVIWLGLFGSALAYLLYFRLLAAWGVTRTTLVTYVMPIVGIALGVFILHEAVDIQVLAGAALVIAGIVLVNAPIGQRRIFGRTAAVVPD